MYWQSLHSDGVTSVTIIGCELTFGARGCHTVLNILGDSCMQKSAFSTHLNAYESEVTASASSPSARRNFFGTNSAVGADRRRPSERRRGNGCTDAAAIADDAEMFAVDSGSEKRRLRVAKRGEKSSRNATLVAVERAVPSPPLLCPSPRPFVLLLLHPLLRVSRNFPMALKKKKQID
ncbi:hypothetical protein niasHS_005695 [Heterodera schachtii]|uniref:Uncharacterized protein n=1 Tax=Heterodera schachtii TaxID=97005 RepID=A0ABD2JZ79_HETSC